MLTSLVIIPEFFVTFASVTKEREGEKRKEARKKIGVLFLLIFSFIPVLVHFFVRVVCDGCYGKERNASASAPLFSLSGGGSVPRRVTRTSQSQIKPIFLWYERENPEASHRNLRLVISLYVLRVVSASVRSHGRPL